MRRVVLKVHGVAYAVAYGQHDGCEKTFRLDRIPEC
jgi:hypothetical protein